MVHMYRRTSGGQLSPWCPVVVRLRLPPLDFPLVLLWLASYGAPFPLLKSWDNPVAVLHERIPTPVSSNNKRDKVNRTREKRRST